MTCLINHLLDEGEYELLTCNLTTMGFEKDREINVCNYVNLSIHLMSLIQRCIATAGK